jgi:hypothetical protein
VALLGRRDKDAGNETSPNETAEDSAQAQAQADIPAELPRTEGPWDEADEYPSVPRVDLGALLIPQATDFRIQVQADQSTGVISQVSLVTDTSAVQLQPYAAPRSGGMWSDVRGQISGQINKSGGLVEENVGPFGVELRAQVQGQDGKLQPARFCGVDGPRWFLRLVFLGQAARDAASAASLEEAVRQVVVLRGDQAMPMGNALPLRVPAEATAGSGAPEAPAAPERPSISLPERGPEITETR